MAVVRHPEIGQRWKVAREAAGYSTVKEAAQAVGCHRNTIYKLENGDEDVTMRMMMRVAPIYGRTLGQILGESDGAERTPREFRPLLEPLRPLSVEQREKLVRNIAANLDFMHTLYASASERSDGDQVMGQFDSYINNQPAV